MALRVPGVEMEDEALAVRPRRVELRIRHTGRAEHLAPLASQAQAERVVDRVPRLVPEDAHAPFVFAAFHLEHLRVLELFEARMRQIEGNGDGRGAVRREPLVRQIEVQRKGEPAGLELLAQQGDPAGQRAFDPHRQVGQPEVEQRFVWKLGPVRGKDRSAGGWRHGSLQSTPRRAQGSGLRPQGLSRPQGFVQASGLMTGPALSPGP